MSAAPLTVLITMQSHPGKRDELVAQCEMITGLGRGEEGALEFSYSMDGDRLLAIEVYADAAACLRHLELSATIAAHSQEIADVENVMIVGTRADLDALADVVARFGASTSEIVAGFQR